MTGLSDAAKVGAAVLIVVALMLGVVQLIRGDLFQSLRTYKVYVQFENGQGLRPGLPLNIAGKNVGSVSSKDTLLTTNDQGQTVNQAEVLVNRGMPLYADATFTIKQEGLLGEKYMDVQPGTSGPGAVPVKEGHVFPGSAQADTSDLVSSAAEVIRRVDSLLSEAQLGQLSTSLSASLDSVNGLLANAKALVESSRGDVVASLKNVQAMSANFLTMSQNLQQASEDIRSLAGDPKYADTISSLTADLTDVSRSLNHLSSQLDTLVSDPQVQQDAKDSVRLTKETLEEAKNTLKRFQQTMDKADTVLDSAGGLMDNASGTVSAARSKLDQVSRIGSSVSVKAGLNVRAVDKNRSKSLNNQDSYVGDINVAAGYKKTYISVGADNIGEQNNWNFLLGHGSLDGFSFRGGVYRGELGLGAAYFLPGGGGAEAMLYDTADPKLNAYGYIPVGDAVNVVVGMEDIENDPQATVGLGVNLK